MLSEVFWTFLISSVCGVILVGVRLCYKSKCKEVDLCCLKIVRDVEGEEKIDVNNPQRINANNSSEKIDL
jgi:hypothetical protein